MRCHEMVTWLVRIALAGMVALICAWDVTAEEAEPEYVARIGETEGITRAEFEQSLQTLTQNLAARAKSQGQPDPGPIPFEGKRRLLEEMINSRILDKLVAEANITVSDEEIQERMESFKEELAGRGVDLDAELAKGKISVEDMKRRAVTLISRKRYVEQQTGAIEVTDEDIHAFYERLDEAGRLDRPAETVDLSHILVAVAAGSDEDAWAAAKKEAESIRKRIVKGEDFGKVAAEASDDARTKEDGGVMREVPRKRFGPEFDKRAFEGTVGEVSEPFRTEYGWHILRVDAQHAAGSTVEEDVVDDRLRLEIERMKRNEIMARVLKEARERFGVKVLLEPEAGETGPGQGGPAGEGLDSLLDHAS